MRRALVVGLVAAVAPFFSSGEMVITEWMYNGAGTGSTGEFVEFTNVGTATLDLAGWSFDDDSRVPGTVSLSALGKVAPGQSVILTDETAEDFAAIWGLSDVRIIGGNTANLSRNDELNLYDAEGSLVDRLSYGDESFPGTVRTQLKSCNIPAADYGFTTVQTGWVLATAGDSFGSQTSSRGEVGSPGRVVGYHRDDFDQDRDVDAADADMLVSCMTGPEVSYEPPPSACHLTADAEGFMAGDEDQDFDLDLADFAAFQVCVSDAGNAADPLCGQTVPTPGGDILLHGDSITVIGSGVTVEGTTATINAAGTYTITGMLNDGQIVVNSAAAEAVELILNGVDITNSQSAPFYVKNAAQATVVLADQTVNYLTDAATYVYDDPNDNEPNAALFSDDALTIAGSGALIVHGNFNDAITSKDHLVILGGDITAIAVDDGIRGKDLLDIQGGVINVTSGGDGLKADNADGPGLGVITVSGGTVRVTAGGDGLSAETDVIISGGNFTVVAGGGSGVAPPDDPSTKGIKGLTSVQLTGGTLNVNASDDAVHANGDITISSPASLTLASHDDAVHADGTIHVLGGNITVTTCYEGIDGGVVMIDNGTFQITSSNDAIDAATNLTIGNGTFTVLSGGGHAITIPSALSAKGVKGLSSVVISGGTFNLDCADDGIHSNGTIAISGGTITIAANSNTNSTTGSYGDGIHADTSILINGGTITVTTAYEGIESPNTTINNGTIYVTTTDDGINAAGGSGLTNRLYINGGYIYVNAAGDGLDANGSIVMTGGTVIVNGPTVNNNAPIDYDGTFTISGGFLLAAGSSGMAQAPSTSSTQRSVKITYSSNKNPGTLVHIQTTTGGTNLLTFAPAKQYRSVVFSAPTLVSGTSCDLYTGGTCNGTVVDGLYTGGTFSGGTKTNTFNPTSIVTNVNAP